MVKSENKWNFQCRVLRSKKWQSLLFQKLRAKVKQTNLRELSEGWLGSRLGLHTLPALLQWVTTLLFPSPIKIPGLFFEGTLFRLVITGPVVGLGTVPQTRALSDHKMDSQPSFPGPISSINYHIGRLEVSFQTL